MPSPSPQRAAHSGPEIPDKLYFRIGEVARLCGVAAHVLRFWESEFPQLRPNKSGTGQRLYRRRDVEMALAVKRLLYDEGYTIAGARQSLQAEGRDESRRKKTQAALPLVEKKDTKALRAEEQQRITQVRSELRALLGMLSLPAPTLPVTVRRRRRDTGEQSSAPFLFDE